MARTGVTGTTLGPFKGGLNNVSEVSSLSDNQLSIVSNFDIDTDGSLVSRPAIVPDAELPTAAAGQPINPLGYYVRADGATFLVCTAGGKTWIYNVATKEWLQIWANVASDFTQYDNKIVLVSAVAAGGYWEDGSFTATSTMPQGSTISLYNERFWISGVKGTPAATTIYFSKLTVITPASSIFDWAPTSDFFTVDKGDGQWITAVIADPNALLIFRNGSTYQFTYPSSPVQGTLRKLNASIGADTKESIGQYENYYMVLHQGQLYQFINYLYYSRNARMVRFERSPVSATYVNERAVSIFGQRCIVHYFGNLYVYNLVQGAWTQWASPTTRAARFLPLPSSTQDGDRSEGLVFQGTTTASFSRVWKIIDDVLPSGDGEPMVCMARTKAYTIQTPGDFKRMMYWTVSYRSAQGVTGSVTPLGLTGLATTWNEMSATTWNELAMGTWNNPLVIPRVLKDEIVYPASAPVQGLAKMDAPIRFLSAYFDIELTTNGTAAQAPARMFSLVAFLKQHAGTREKVS